MEEIGRVASGPGRVYLVGGATALLLGMRAQTIDIDLKLDPEPNGVFEAIADLKERLSVNVELASPDQFLPPLPGWRDRSEFIKREGLVEFFHYDFYSQALAKISRGFVSDVADARFLVNLGKVDQSTLMAFLEQILPEIHRYPAIDVEVLKSSVEDFVHG